MTMLKRVSRGFGHTGKQAQKFHLAVFVEKLDNMPASIKRCRVVWSRGPKVQMTGIKDVAKGAVVFKQQLNQIATMYKDSLGTYEPKEYRFQVQVPDKADAAKFITVGKADLDLSFFVSGQGQAQNKLIPILFKIGPASTGYLKVTITPELAHDVGDDGMTEVSGMTGVNPLSEEQDLSGFNEEAEEAECKQSPASGSSGKKTSRFATCVRPPSPLPAVPSEQLTTSQPKAQETKRPKDSAPGPRKIAPNDSSRALAAAAAAVDGKDDDDGDISPVSLSPSTSLEPPAAEATKPSSRESGPPSIVGAKGGHAAAAASVAAKDARSQLLGTGPVIGSVTAGKSMERTSSNRSIPELTEDEARSELFSSNGTRSSARASKRSTAAPTAISNTSAAHPNRMSATPSSTAQGVTTSGAASVSLPPAAAVSSMPGAGKASGALSANGGGTTGNAAASVASAATSVLATATAGAAVCRGLLARARPMEVPGFGAASTAVAGLEGPGSRKSAAAANRGSASGERKHSLSDADGDDSAEELGYKIDVQPLTAPAGSSRQSSASHISQSQRQGPRQQQRPSNSDTESTASKQLAADNEKLRAQVAALRDQVTQAEDARRQARLAAENAAAEREDYKEQVQELQHQLKEAIVGTLSSDEAGELHKQVKELQQPVRQQEQQLQQLQQQEQHLQQQHSSASQHVRVTHDKAHWEQQAIDTCGYRGDRQEQQEHAAESTVHHDVQSSQVEYLQQLLQEQVQLVRQQQEQLHSQLCVTAELEQQLAEQSKRAQEVSTKLERQQDTILELLIAEAVTAAQDTGIQQHMADKQLMVQVQELVMPLGQGSHVHDQVLQILVAFKAAVLVAGHHTSTDARVKEAQTAQPADMQQQQQQQQQQELPGMAEMTQQMAQPEAEVSKLNEEKQQYLHEQLQQKQQHLMSEGLGKHSWQGDDVEVLGPLIRAGLQQCHSTSGDGSQEELVQAKQELAKSTRKVQQLKQAREKLEIILHDFETTAAEEKQQLLIQLSSANQATHQVNQRLTESQHQLADALQQLAKTSQQLVDHQQQLHEAEDKLQQAQRQQHKLQERLEAVEAVTATASSSTKMIALADSAGPPGLQEAVAVAHEQIADLQKQLSEAEASRRSLDTEVVLLRRQFADEQSERAALEEQLARKLEDTEDYIAQDMVAAFEAKYNRLKTRYHELTESHREEVDQLHDDIAALQERMVDLEAAAAQLEAARSQAQHGEATLADSLAKSSKVASELTALRTENQTMMQDLVSAKLELALCREREVVGKRELYKTKETNMKLASKMTKLETLIYKK